MRCVMGIEDGYDGYPPGKSISTENVNDERTCETIAGEVIRRTVGGRS